MSTILIEKDIIECSECPFIALTNQWSSDDWDSMEDWECTKMPTDPDKPKNKKGKLISSYVEWNERVLIPEWCPILKK